MKPGPELDALVAEKVMGWELKPHPECKSSLTWFYRGREMCFERSLPYYSTSIEAAWEVVEKLRELNGGDVFEFRLTWTGNTRPTNYTFRIWETDLPQVDMEDFYAPTAPHAICLAALKAADK